MFDSSENPPSTNRGVTYPKTQDQLLVRYDWFEGLINLDIERAIADISKVLNGQYDECLSSRTSKGVFCQRGWGYSFQFMQDEKPILTLSYGGQNGQYGVHFKTTGSPSHDIALKIKDIYAPNGLDLTKSCVMTCNRVDLAIDVFCDYSQAVERCIEIGEQVGFEFGTAGDWVSKNPETGRTLYLKRTNNVKMRVYEKGKEQREKGFSSDAPLDWVRFELEIRSAKGKNNRLMREVLAGAKPLELFQMYKEYVFLMNSLGYDSLQYNHIATSMKSEPSSMDKGLKVMVKQYEKYLDHFLSTPENFSKLLLEVYSDPNDIPQHLKKTHSGFIAAEHDSFLKHGEY